MHVVVAGAHDVLILGGGTAGCVLAARLSEEPRRSVCLVEAGPDHGLRDGGPWPPEMLDGRAVPDTHDWRDDAGAFDGRARDRWLLAPQSVPVKCCDTVRTITRRERAACIIFEF